MITPRDLYTVLSAVIPLYVAMILAYGSVRWWKIFTPDQCSGINRFVALFAVPLLSFHFIASSNPFELNLRFLAADSLAKLIFLAVLALWLRVSKRGSLEWLITLFSLATLPNTLVMGIPLLTAMYGEYSGKLMVQIVVLQCIIWYTLLLFLFEYRAARNLIAEQFPGMAASIVSFKVDSDVMSLDGGRDMLQTEAEVGGDGKLHVKVRRSVSSRCPSVMSSRRPSFATGGMGGAGLMSLPSLTPRPSNLTGAEIYSIHSSRNPTPRGSSFNPAEFYSMMQQQQQQQPNNPQYNSHNNFGLSDLYSLNSSRGPTPRTSNFDLEENPTRFLHNPTYNTPKQFAANNNNNSYDISMVSSPSRNAPPLPPNGNNSLPPAMLTKKIGDHHQSSHKTTIGTPRNIGDESKEMHMFVWSSSASPVSDGGGLQAFGGRDTGIIEMAAGNTNNHTSSAHAGSKDKQAALHNMQPNTGVLELGDEYTKDEFSFGNHNFQEKDVRPRLSKVGSNSTLQLGLKLKQDENKKDTPPTTVMTKLILVMVWRKLIRNPNTYSSLLGVVWSLVSFRWDIAMPRIIKGSISILSDAGLGMAMFSLGLFMALQPRLIPCGNSIAAFGMAVRFLTGPAVMAVASIVVGLRGVLLHVAIVQAALPQGIVPFVFAKEYNVHPDILSTGVIFGMIIALPITLLYYFFLGL